MSRDNDVESAGCNKSMSAKREESGVPTSCAVGEGQMGALSSEMQKMKQKHILITGPVWDLMNFLLD